MPKHSYPDPMKTTNVKSGNKTAFPPNREPRGREYFGPRALSARPVTGNVFNKDRFGKSKPWERSGR